MCGIVGIIRKDGKTVPFHLLKALTNKMIHRGPDGEGHYIENNIGLGHRRLSIIDLSDDGAQPMERNNKIIIIFNGEIYNYLELRDQLVKLGHKFKTKSDTEVILASYEQWGEQCVSRFNGMWAFAIYDKVQKRFFCSRDRFGVKPFYYVDTPNFFAFSSEIKPLLLLGISTNVHLPTLANYLALGILNSSDRTFFQNVKKLLPSRNLIYDLNQNSFSITQYYSLTIDEKLEQLSEVDSFNLYATLLEDSIRLRLRADVTVGTCLSGGLDSSYIASIASSLYRKDTDQLFKAITAKSVDKNKDESHFAQMVANYANLDISFTEPTVEDFQSVLDESILLQEEPTAGPSTILQYFVMKKSKELKCKVLLDGQGGDETLLGYERYYAMYLHDIPVESRLKAYFQITKNSGLTKTQLLLNYLYFNYPFLRKQVGLNRARILSQSILSSIDWDFLDTKKKASRNVRDIQINEITTNQLTTLLNYEDKNSMWNSIETRLPFLDYRVVETALSLNTSCKIKNGWSKYILRRISEKVLPPEVTWRKNKFGFEAPIKSWLDRTKMLAVVKESRHAQELGIDTSIQGGDILMLWRVFNFALWAKRYDINIDKS